MTHTIEGLFPQVRIPARHAVSGEERVYQHAKDVVDEVVEARMLVGVHFRSADVDGTAIGRKIAEQILRDRFRRSR